MNLVIEPLTKENLEKRADELFSLEHNWTELGEEAWDKRNFQLEISGKWKLSLLALMDEKVVGYAISSFEEDVAKLNKIIVDSDFRKNGIATKLWECLLAKCRGIGVNKLEFKVLKDNSTAIDFYRKKNCVFYGESLGSDGKMRDNVGYVFKTERIRHSKPTISEKDAIAAYSVVKSGGLATGDCVDEFVRTFADFIGIKFGVATNSGTSALHIALRALDIKKDDEVIIPSYVCGSVLSAVKYCGANPIIADINEDYNLSLKDTRRKLTKNTMAIILPHMFGKPSSEIEGFMELGIPVIEDCAMSVGAEHNGKRVGSFGDISIFSFYATKVITTGSGGMLLTDNERIIEKANDLLKYDNRVEFDESYNYMMGDIQASLGLSQLSKLDSFITRRREIAGIYNSVLRDSKDFRLPSQQENIFFRYAIRTIDADSLIENLRMRGIDASKPVFTPLHRYLGLSDQYFPNTSSAFRESVSIPIYPGLSEKEIYDMTSVILNHKNEVVKAK